MKSYAIAGTGTRGLCFARAIVGPFAHAARIGALYDHNLTRMRAFAEAAKTSAPTYTDFRRMAEETRPDVLIVTTPDHSHDELIELAFQHDMDVICEKPMATTTEKIRRIFALERRFGRKVRVAFNVRYSTFAQRFKRTLMEQNLGPIRNVQLEWYIDKVHGAEYFRRWHRRRAHSGGLIVHKATHHFDYVNWLLEDRPVTVSAFGSLRFYGRNGRFRGDTCRTCDHTHECPFYFDTTRSDDDSMIRMRTMYLDAEHEDGYKRDNCIFGEDIDIHDTVSVIAAYRGGAQLAYSLTAYAPCEGYRLSVTGTNGRIEAEQVFGGRLIYGDDDAANMIRVIHGQTRKDIEVQEQQVPIDRTDHGGGDTRLYRHLFESNVSDPLGQSADSVDGANSCLIGICANRSIDEGRIISVPNLQAPSTPKVRRAIESS